MNYQPFPGQRPPPKRGVPTWLIVLGAIGAVFALGLLVVGVFIWRVWHGLSEADRGEIKDSTSESWRAAGAPGAAAVHDVGCMANVIDVPTMPVLTRDYSRGGIKGKPQPVDVDVVVECVTQAFGVETPPTCERVAATYVSAAHPKGPFRAMVLDPKHALVCNMKFDASGAKLAPTGE